MGINSDCTRKSQNLGRCNCTYEPCPRKGTCCECIAYHKKLNELPACYFDEKPEATYNRSILHFISLNS